MNQVTFTTLNFWMAFAALFMVIALIQQFGHSWTRHAAIRKGLLVVFSLALYFWIAQHLIWVLMISIFVNHAAAIGIHKSEGFGRKLLTGVGLAFNIFMLGFFKYSYFIAELIPHQVISDEGGGWQIERWMLPLGISFFTFQAISYLIDVHRKTIEQPASLLSFAAYITFFPQLVAGPIVRATQFLPQLESTQWTASRTEDSKHVSLILKGFLKKLLLGDLIGAWLVDPVFNHPESWASWEVLLALYGYSMQVYADFSGYTDMAKGMAGLLGIQLPENFRLPYRSTSPSDFWRRWHMTLSHWWKDYLYIPLGGNRTMSGMTILISAIGLTVLGWQWNTPGIWLLISGATLLLIATMLMSQVAYRKIATAQNVMIVMVIGGLWHGAHANFVTWGSINGAVIVVWMFFPKGRSRWWKRWIGWALTFHSVVLARIWFRAGSLISWDESTSNPHPEDAWDIARALWLQLKQFSIPENNTWFDITFYYGIVLLAVGYAAHFVPSFVRRWLDEKTKALPMWWPWLMWSALTVFAVWCSHSYNKPFIYWQF